MQTRRPVTSRLAAGALVCAGAFFALSTAQAAEPSYFAIMPVAGSGVVGQLRPVTLALAGAVPPPASVGIPYSFSFGKLLSLDGPEGTSASKVRWSVVSGTLPDGLTLTGDLVSGTPSILTPPSQVNIQAQYADGARLVDSLASYSFQVLHPVSIGFNGGAVPPVYVGLPYQVDLTQFLALDGPVGTDPAYVQWSVLAGSLPTGLSLVGSQIVGIPTVLGIDSMVTIGATYADTTPIAQASAQYQFTTALMDGLKIGSLSASPTSIAADGSATSMIMATVTDSAGNSVGAGVPVAWTTSLGVLVSQDKVTDEEGKANAVLRAGSVAGTATIRSTVGGRSSEIDVNFSRPSFGDCRYDVNTRFLVSDLYAGGSLSGALLGSMVFYGPNEAYTDSWTPKYSYANPVPEGSSYGLPAGYRRGRLMASSYGDGGTFDYMFSAHDYEVCKIP